MIAVQPLPSQQAPVYERFSPAQANWEEVIQPAGNTIFARVTTAVLATLKNLRCYCYNIVIWTPNKLYSLILNVHFAETETERLIATAKTTALVAIIFAPLAVAVFTATAVDTYGPVLIGLKIIGESVPYAIAVISGVTNLPANERKKCADQALRLITENMNCHSRKAIVEAVAAIHADERKECVNQALLQITPTMNYQERLSILQRISPGITSTYRLKLELGPFNNCKSLDTAYKKWLLKNHPDKAPKDPVSQRHATAQFQRVADLKELVLSSMQ